MHKKISFIAKIQNLFRQYIEFNQEVFPNKFRIIGFINNKNNKIDVQIMIRGAKNQIPVHFSPEKVVQDDELIKNLSQIDVRTITFLAIYNETNFVDRQQEASLTVMGHEFFQEKSLFVFKEKSDGAECRRLASELYADPDLLKKFSFDDILNIVTTAVQEQTFEDLG